MARDTVEILRSSVPLLRPQDRCPGEIYVNFADRIFGYIDAAGVPQDVGPLVFTTVAALAAYDAAVAPPNGVLAFAADAFFIKEIGGVAAGLPGWRELALGGGGGDFDDTELRRLIAEETQNRIDGDATVTAVLRAEVTVERTARIDGDTALASEITTLSATVDANDTNTSARITQESIARAEGDDALASEITALSASVVSEASRLDARVTSESAARVSGDVALGIRIDNLSAGGGFDDTELRALISTESQARVDGDSALASEITTLSANLDAVDSELSASITQEAATRTDADSALASQIDTVSAQSISRDNALDARVTNESFARVGGDVALGIRIDNIEVGGGFDDTELRALITDESQARVAGDEALASRTTTLEVFRTDTQVSGGNLIQNGLLALGNAPWEFLGANGWVIESRDAGPSEFALVTRAPGTVRANDGEYLPAPSRRLDFEIFVERLAGTVGGVVARLDLGTAVGQPLSALTATLDSEVGTIEREVLSFDLPEAAALWRLSFTSTVSAGAIELRAPFLGLRGKDFEAEINSLGARITDESLARIDGDTALASRSTTLEAFRRDVERNGGNLIDNSTLSVGTDSWVLGAWQTAERIGAPNDEVFTLAAVNNSTLRPNGGAFRPLGFEALSLWFWMLETTSTTGSLTAEIFVQIDGEEQSVAVETYVFNGVTPTWRVEQFSVETPPRATGWRVEFRADVLTGRVELALPFVGFAGQDFSPEIGELSARITEESEARITGDTALATRASTLEAFRRDVQQTGGNLIDNATLTDGNTGWTPLAGWAIADRADAPNPRVFTRNAPAGEMALFANNAEFRPVVLQEFTLRLWFRELPGTAGEGMRIIIADRDVTGFIRTRPPVAVVPITGVPGWRTFTTTVLLVPEAVAWRVQFDARLTTGGIEFCLPFAGVSSGATTNDFDELVARITDESIARVAGDTALAQRSTVLEVENLQGLSEVQSVLFGAYDTAQQMEDAGWTFQPPLPPRGTPERPYIGWNMADEPFAGGFRTLRYDGNPGPAGVLLLAPRVLANPTRGGLETHRAFWEVQRDGNPDTIPALEIFAGWLCLNADGERLETDAGFLSCQAAFAQSMPGSDTTRSTGFTTGLAGVGGGFNTGGRAPDIMEPTPFPIGVASVRLAWFGTGPAAATGVNLNFVRAEHTRVSRERDLRASITQESTVRATADEALAQQIQQIIATEAQGTQTFFQPTAPLNPEPGWLWFRDTGPGVPDEIFRWNGIGWIRIDTAQANDLTLLQAQINDETLARVGGDQALAFRASSLEASSIRQDADINNTNNEVFAANARITTESQARINGDNVLAQRSSTLETNVNGVTARVTTTEQAIDGIEARYSVRVDGNNRVAGIELLAGGNQSQFNVLADAFRVFNPISGTDEPVFAVVDGRTFIREAFIPLLSTSTLKIDDVVFDTNAEGELTVRQLGVTTNLLAPNATNVAYAYSQIVAGAGAAFPRNVWSTVTLNGVPATVRVTNGPIGGALVKFDVNLLVRNFGANSDVASFRIQRSDGFILPTQYTSMYIDDTPNNAFGNQAMTFFDVGLAPDANFTYTFQMNSNEESPVRALHVFGMLFKNSQAAPFSAPLP